MIKVFQVPVILNEDESFDEMTYQAEGIADYWDVKSKEYKDPQSALDDIKAQLTKQFQKALFCFVFLGLGGRESTDFHLFQNQHPFL